jgi:hypothetical protein
LWQAVRLATEKVGQGAKQGPVVKLRAAIAAIRVRNVEPGFSVGKTPQAITNACRQRAAPVAKQVAAVKAALAALRGLTQGQWPMRWPMH